MSEYDSFKVLQVECSKCGSKPGSDCITRNGTKAGDFHTARKAVVYPSYGQGTRGNTGKRGVKGSNPATVRNQLRNKVIDLAVKLYTHEVPEIELMAAVKALKYHRAKHPGIRG